MKMNTSHSIPARSRQPSVIETARNYLLYYKDQMKLCLSFILIAMTFLVGSVAYCETEKTLADYEGQDLGAAKSVLDNIDNICSGTNLAGIKELLHVEYSANSEFKIFGNTISIGSALNGIYKIFQSAGLYLVILFFAISLWEDFSFSQVAAEKLFKKAICFVFAIVLVAKGQEIVYSIANMGTVLVDKAFLIMNVETTNVTMDHLKVQVIEKVNTSASASYELTKMVANIADHINALGINMSLALPGTFCKIVGVFLQFICISRFIEIVLMGLISPIAFADISKGSIEHSSAFRLIKNVLALAISGAIILLICWICAQLQVGLISSGMDMDSFTKAAWNCVCVGLVQMTMSKKATDIAKSAMGMV